MSKLSEGTGVEIITNLANQVFKKQYPMLGTHFNNYDVAVVLHSYFELIDYSEKIKLEELGDTVND